MGWGTHVTLNAQKPPKHLYNPTAFSVGRETIFLKIWHDWKKGPVGFSLFVVL